MIREIKFRGKRVDNSEWVYGSYLYGHGFGNPIHYISVYTTNGAFTDFIPKKVIPETVGQYTGLKDINGVEIYEGDVLIIGKLKGVVSYDGKGMLGFETKTMIYHLGHFNINNYEVIGNIHDKEEE